MAPSEVPVQFRGLDFTVQRGDGVRIVHDRSHRYLDLVQGASADFATSLNRAPAFWSEAKAISITVEGIVTSGWLLAAPPNTVVYDVKSGQKQQVAGPRWLLLPDIGGTAVLITSQGYSDEEILTAAAELRKIR